PFPCRRATGRASSGPPGPEKALTLSRRKTIPHPTQEVTVSDEYRKLTREELTDLAGEELPERAAMSLVNANIAAPINAAVALNALSDGSTAYANAEQNIGDLKQGN